MLCSGLGYVLWWGGLFFCYAVVIFHIQWCTRKPRPSSIILCNISTANDDHTNNNPYIFPNPKSLNLFSTSQYLNLSTSTTDTGAVTVTSGDGDSTPQIGPLELGTLGPLGESTYDINARTKRIQNGEFFSSNTDANTNANSTGTGTFSYGSSKETPEDKLKRVRLCM